MKDNNALVVCLSILGLLQVVTTAYTVSIDGRVGRIETVMMGRK